MKTFLDLQIEKRWKPVLFVVLNLLFFLTLLLSLYVYTYAWYDPRSNGMEFLVLYFVVFPTLLLTGIFLFIFGRFFHISMLNKCLPFIAVVGLFLPTTFVSYLDLGPFQMWSGNKDIVRLAGASIAAVLSLLVIATTVANLTSQGKKQ